MRLFTFTESWLLHHPPGAVRDVLLDLERYPEWWPEVRAVARVSDEEALVVCRSVLPYSLDLHLTAVSRSQSRLEIGMDGDLVGSAAFHLVDGGDRTTRVEFSQQVRVTGPLLRAGAGFAGPLLAWNHRRMMRSCLRGLRARLDTGA